MRFLEKYWLILFLIDNLTSKFHPLAGLSTIAFFLSLFVAVLIVARNIGMLISPQTIRKYPFVYALVFSIILYQLTFGWFHINPKSWSYFFAKPIYLLALIVSVNKNFEFYSKDFFVKASYVIVGCLIYGALFHNRILDGTRSDFGFGNPNSLGAVAALSFGYFFMLIDKFNWKNIAVCLVCLYAVLESGSRTALAVVLLALFFKYGINWRTIRITLLSLGAIIILNLCGIHFVGIDRFVDTIEEGEYNADREAEREAAILMINNSPITGNGLYAGNSKEAREISELGSHNGYLDILKQFGIPFSCVIFFFLLWDSIRLTLRYRKTTDWHKKGHLLIVVSVLACAMNEGYFWGVHEYTTSVHFISLIILCTHASQRFIPQTQS